MTLNLQNGTFHFLPSLLLKIIPTWETIYVHTEVGLCAKQLCGFWVRARKVCSRLTKCNKLKWVLKNQSLSAGNMDPWHYMIFILLLSVDTLRSLAHYRHTSQWKYSPWTLGRLSSQKFKCTQVRSGDTSWHTTKGCQTEHLKLSDWLLLNPLATLRPTVIVRHTSGLLGARFSWLTAEQMSQVRHSAWIVIGNFWKPPPSGEILEDMSFPPTV